MFNEVTLIARLGKDPELKHTPSGKAICSMRVVTSETSIKDGEKVEKSQWHNIIVWDKQAETCHQYLKKGSLAFIKGRLEYQEYKDKDGNMKNRTEIVANTVRFLSPAKGKEDEAPRGLDPFPMATTSGFTDIPF